MTVTVCAGAFWKGGREEQLAAGGLLLGFALTVALRDGSWAGIQWSAFVTDVCLLLLLTAIALRSERYWPVAAAAFQLLSVVTHIARMVDPGVMAWAYATAQVIWSQLLVVAIGVGAWNAWRAGRLPVDDRRISDPGPSQR